MVDMVDRALPKVLALVAALSLLVVGCTEAESDDVTTTAQGARVSEGSTTQADTQHTDNEESDFLHACDVLSADEWSSLIGVHLIDGEPIDTAGVSRQIGATLCKYSSEESGLFAHIGIELLSRDDLLQHKEQATDACPSFDPLDTDLVAFLGCLVAESAEPFTPHSVASTNDTYYQLVDAGEDSLRLTLGVATPSYAYTADINGDSEALGALDPVTIATALRLRLAGSDGDRRELALAADPGVRTDDTVNPDLTGPCIDADPPMALGAEAAVPDDFELPVPSGGELLSSSVDACGVIAIGVQYSADRYSEFVATYRRELTGTPGYDDGSDTPYDHAIEVTNDRFYVNINTTAGLTSLVLTQLPPSQQGQGFW